MVRWLWQNRLVAALQRFLRLLVRKLLLWLRLLLQRLRIGLQVSRRMLRLLVRPRDPNNLFVVSPEASYQASEQSCAMQEGEGPEERRPTLLWASSGTEKAMAAAKAMSLWHGERISAAAEAAPGIASANRRFAYVDLLATPIRKLPAVKVADLEELIQRLARKWLDVDQRFELRPRRNRLNIGRTLRYNIPRYAGRILEFQWATKERPVPQLSKPANILVIGDVSHSMVHYVSILLFFFHELNFQFRVDSYIFSERATHSTPYLNGLGTFEEKMKRLMEGALSWNAGTRFGSALDQIAASAVVDENTYVLIVTDGKISLQGDEAVKIERYMESLRARAKQVIFVTPAVEFADGAGGKVQPQPIGSFKYDFYEIPIFQMGPPVWYGTLGQYADRIYLVRTVQDLIAMTEDLINASKD